MPLDESHRPGRQLFRGDSRFLSGLCPLLCGLPRLFRILLLDAPLLQIPGKGPLAQLGMLQSRHPALVVCRSLDIFGLGPLDGLGWVFPDSLFCIVRTMPQGGLAHQLGVVSALGAHILMLHLVDFAVDKCVNAAASRPARPFDRAGAFGRLLICQLVTSLRQLLAPLFHTELGLRRLFLPALVSEL